MGHILTNEEATAARGGFRLGDSARFSIFSGEAGDWAAAYPTAPFPVDELPELENIPWRVAH